MYLRDEYRLRVGVTGNLYLILHRNGDVWLVPNPPDGVFYPEDWCRDGGSAVCVAREAEEGQDLVELMEAVAAMLGAVTVQRLR